MFRKKFFFLVSVILLSTGLQAQNVKVKKDNANVKSEQVSGFAVELVSPATEVTAAFVKFLKGTGKVRQTTEVITIHEPTINGIKYTPAIYAVTKARGEESTAWIGIVEKEWAKGDVDRINKELEKMIYDFGVQFYRGKIQVQVDESTRASAAVTKQQQRLLNEGKALSVKLEDNKREKIQLDKALENNKLENEELLKKIEKNKHDQDSVALAGEQIKKVVEMHKEKQRKVN
jgi:hypothetical protein